MSAPAPRSRPVADLDEARLTKLLAEREAATARIVEIDGKLADLCRAYSRAHGYRIVLRPDQVRRAIEAEKGPSDA